MIVFSGGQLSNPPQSLAVIKLRTYPYINMDNSLIKEIHDAATSEKVQQTIALFNPAESHVTNKDKLVSDCQHKDLAETISHLKTQREKYPSIVQALVKKASRTKDPIASDICEFLEQLKPADCSACNNEYLPVASENVTNNNVTCQICSKFSHKTCYDGSNVNPAIGIYYICNMCCINFKQFCEVPAAPTEEKSKDEAPAAAVESSPSRRHATSQPSGDSPPPRTRSPGPGPRRKRPSAEKSMCPAVAPSRTGRSPR